MSNRNNLSYQRARHFSDPAPSRQGTKYHRRGGKRNNRPEPNRRSINPDDVHSLTVSIGQNLTTDGNASQDSFFADRSIKHTKNSRPSLELYSTPSSKRGWWRITVYEAGKIGKQLVIDALQSKCVRPFLPYHYHIETRSKDGVFFVNNQTDADNLKRLNGKVEVRGIDTLRIVMCRVQIPAPFIDEDLRPHLKDHFLSHRFDPITQKLDLTNLADDEELSSLGILPQTNKHAFMRAIIEIINKDFPTTRMLDLGSNNIMSLDEFRNLQLANLVQISFASNRLRTTDDFDHLKQLPNLVHIYIKNNPLTLSNAKQNNSSKDINSTIQKKIPQLKRIDDTDLPAIIHFATDIEDVKLPTSIPYCVPPGEIETFLNNFIQIFFSLFDKPNREDLQQCYHDLCMFSLCITNLDSSVVPVRQSRYGLLIHESRNLKKLVDDNRRNILLRHGKTNVMEFLRKKFPSTEHDGNSFRVDVISSVGNRLIFTINGLYKEVDQTTNNPIRCFHRTFTCAPTAAGILIIADHIMLSNATEAQISKMKQTSTTVSQTTNSSTAPKINPDLANQMIHHFSQQSGMNIESSKQCLELNNWDYNKAAANFLDLQQRNQIPAEAFVKS